MIINWEKGHKGEHDRKILITSNGKKEPFKIFKLCLLLNQLSINEQNIRKDNDYTTNYFKPAINDCLEMSEDGIDWAEEENVGCIVLWCKKHHLKFEKIEHELRKHIQTKLGDFKE